jgi:hypothetical protein
MIGRRDKEHAATNNYVYLIGADRLSDLILYGERNDKYIQMELDLNTMIQRSQSFLRTF